MAQHYQVFFLNFLFLMSRTNCELIGYVVNGEDANIKDFSYSAFLFITIPPEDHKRNKYYCCGSSILNQDILLTAGHCVNGCNSGSSIIASVGNENKRDGTKIFVTTIYVHGKFDMYKCVYDIGLLKLDKPLKFSSTVSRVAITRKPPYSEKALIAGWGLVNEIDYVPTNYLHFIEQNVWDRKKCDREGFMTYPGVFCAQAPKHSEYSSRGDSGTALVVRGYIQIGIVSYKYIDLERSVVLYTDVGAFYDWIYKYMPDMYCNGNERK